MTSRRRTVSENDQAGAVGQPRSDALGSPGLTRLVAWLAAAAIVASVLIMVVISAAGPNVSVPALPASSGLPWWHHSLHLTATFVTVSLWVAMVLGCAGVIAGLIAVDRGARPPVRALVAFAVLAVAVFTLLPSAGSTDSISYAASGRTAVIGHSPYVMTPLQLERSGDPIGRQIPFAEIPSTWTTTVSVYGPVATGAEWVAAELGGTSLARITFWLKLEEALAFGVVIAALDRMLRREEGLRLRAHLLWSVNPLLLWEIVAGGHIDGLAVVFGLLGVAALRARDGRFGVGAAAVAGVLTGVATGIKVEYVLFAAAVAWACRRSIRPLAAAAAGFLLVVVPAYLAAGPPAIKILGTRSSGVTWDTMYQLFWRPILGYTQFSARCGGAHARPGTRPPGRDSGPSAEPGLAVLHGLPATLVRRDGHQPAGAVFGVPPGLGGPAPPAGGCDHLRAGRPEPRRTALAVRRQPVQRRVADARHPPGGRGGAGLAVRFRPLGLALAAGDSGRPAARAVAVDLNGVIHRRTLWITPPAMTRDAYDPWQIHAHVCGLPCGQRVR